MFDHGLAAQLATGVDREGRIASVILGNDGMALDTIRQAPIHGQAAAILLAVDRMTERYPERFQTLPDPFASPSTEIIEDPTHALEM
jgi:hypothetical protein